MNHNIQYLNWTFGPDKIRDGNLYLVTSLLNSSLEVNVLSATVECDDRSILDFERNTPLSYYTQPDRPMIFRVQSIKRAGPNTYAISATSTLGLLSEGQHYGGIYTGQTAQEVIADICGTVPFVVKSNLAGIKLYGWLPIASPRDNLAQVLFAIGAALKTDLDGVLRIEGLWDGISGTVTRNDMYTEAAAEYDGKVTQVIVSEHQYVPWTEEKQLFEGTAQAGDIITFDEPMHSLKADGFSIQASGANWARVSAGPGVLSGKTYIHNTRQITEDVWPAKEPNVKTVKDATLVSLVNSQACAQRLADYYRCRERVDAPVVYHGELPGDRLATYHPFDKTGVAACLESADITLSNTLKAQEKSLVGFVPPQIEQVVTYDHRELLTESGEWTVPEGVSSVRVVLIGGGQNGMNGRSGISIITTSKSYTSPSYTTPSSSKGMPGGEGGEGGEGGKVFESFLDVTGGETIPYVIGQAAEASVFGDLTSESGGSMPTGWLDIITGEIYAAPGNKGIAGGQGGDVGNYGEPVNGYSGGPPRPGGDIPADSDVKKALNTSWSGSGGGGASANASGEKGLALLVGYSGYIIHTDRKLYDGTVSVRDYGGGDGAEGGSGADAVIPGCGGDGGNGGGGAGGYSSVSTSPKYATERVNGHFQGVWISGGSGGKGGAGAPGCIILYYGIGNKIQPGQLVDKNNQIVLDRLGRRIIM